jgi:acetyl esterase/lipase
MAYMTMLKDGEKDYFEQYVAQIDESCFDVQSEDGTLIKVWVTRPKTLADNKQAPAYIYAHGGAALISDAEHWQHVMAITAVNLNCVCFSVDFRNGPEVKCPTG